LAIAQYIYINKYECRMKKLTFICILSVLILASFNIVKAQNTIDLENLERPEVELIIGLSYPKNSEALILQLQNVIDNNDEYTLPTSENGIMLDDESDITEDDILEDYLDDLQNEPGGEPDKEELVLERLKSPQSKIVSLYPNPAINFINVKVEDLQNYEIEVYDLIGNLVINDRIVNNYNTEYKLDTSNLQNGIYLMHIVSPLERIIKKFGIN